MSKLPSGLTRHIPNFLKPARTLPEPASHLSSSTPVPPAPSGRSPRGFLPRRPAWAKNLFRFIRPGNKAPKAPPLAPAISPGRDNRSPGPAVRSPSPPSARGIDANSNAVTPRGSEIISSRSMRSDRTAPTVAANDDVTPEAHSVIRRDFFSRMEQRTAQVKKEILQSIKNIEPAEIERYDLNWMAFGYSLTATNNIKADVSKELYALLHATELSDAEKTQLSNALTTEFNDWISQQEKDLNAKLKAMFPELKQLPGLRKAMFAKVEPIAKAVEREMLDAINAVVVVVPKGLRDAPSSHAARANNKIAAVYEELKCDLVMQRRLPTSLKKILLEDLKTRQAKDAERLHQTAIDKFNEHQWFHDPSAPMWEQGSPPLLIRRDEVWNLMPADLQLGEGGFGSVSLWKSATNEFAAKMERESAKPMLGGVDSLKVEYQAFKEVYEKAGPHRNLVNAYGIANMQVNGVNHRMLLMDCVPGLAGDQFISKLRLSLETGKIKSAEYVGALQFIFSRLADALEHVNKAGLAHADVKLENFIVRDDGEPVLIDMGLAQEHKSTALAGTEGLMSTDFAQGGFTEKSDVFSLAASVVDAMEGRRKIFLNPASGDFDEVSPDVGAVTGRFWVDDDRGDFRQAVVNQISTAYSQFVNKQLRATDPETGASISSRPDDRDNMAGVMQNPFLADRVLADEESEKKAIRKVLAIIGQESGKSPGEQWKTVGKRHAARLPEDENDPGHIAEVTKILEVFLKTPSLEGVIQLRAVSRASTMLTQHIDSLLREPRIIMELYGQANRLLGDLVSENVSTWLDSLAQSTSKIVESSGKKNGEGRTPTRREIADRDENAMVEERHILAQETVEYLERYAYEASLVLDGYVTIPGVEANPESAEAIALIRKNVAIAKDILRRIERSEPIEAVINPRPMRERIEELDELLDELRRGR